MKMRESSLIYIGKGNADWNYSSPHGVGRILSRAQVFKQLSMDNLIHSMNGIYSKTVIENTFDESPMVYKPMEEIVTNIQDTVKIINIIKPVYNYKASE